ncbi:MAG: hypothetical protein ITG02_01160 [Patulibacter sp.]|nr:hypothetical protein [Patulibacter sp.]
METTITTVVLAVIVVLLLWRLTATERAATEAAAERERSHVAEVEDDLARIARIEELETDIADLTAGPLIHKRVIASLTGDEGGIDGILTDWRGEWVRFESVRFIGGKGQVEPVDGAVYVQRTKILTLHDPPAASVEAE